MRFPVPLIWIMNLLAAIWRLLFAVIVVFWTGSAATSSMRSVSGMYNTINTSRYVLRQAATPSQAAYLLVLSTSWPLQSVLLSYHTTSKLARLQGSASGNRIDVRSGKIAEAQDQSAPSTDLHTLLLS